jgi:anti-sigma factor RsiW
MVPDRYAPLLSAALDGELGRFARWRMARHLKTCPSCAARLEELQTMQGAIRAGLTRHRAPPGLAQRIGNMLPRGAEVPVLPVLPVRARWRLAPLAGTGFAGALAGMALTLLVLGAPMQRTNSAMTEAVLNSHIRSLEGDHLTDVLTSDQHTVKPSLSARLDVSPNVTDFVAEGIPLVGGREDYIDDHPAAAVVYRHAKHVINLFAGAASDAVDAPFRSETRQGFKLISWRHGGIEYVAVSDVEMDQLAAFTRLVAGAV